jgi:hypothetical protein
MTIVCVSMAMASRNAVESGSNVLKFWDQVGSDFIESGMQSSKVVTFESSQSYATFLMMT